VVIIGGIGSGLFNRPSLTATATVTTAPVVAIAPTNAPSVTPILPSNTAIVVISPSSTLKPTLTASLTTTSPPSGTLTTTVTPTADRSPVNAETKVAQTYTARAVNAIASYTKTLTPSPTLNDEQIAATIVAANDMAVTSTQHVIDQTATATLWTLTPTSTFTPTNTSTTTNTATNTPTMTPTETPIPAGTERTDSNGIKQVYVPAGCFKMGITDSQAQNTITQWVKAGVTQSDVQTIIKSAQPQHQVCITKAYWFDEFEATNAAFDNFVKAGGYTNDNLWSADGLSWKQNGITGPSTECTQDSSQPNQPRVCVNYYEAEAYAKWRGGRLPTEAEWEYAALGTTGWTYPWGDTFDQSKTNSAESKIGKTTPVDAYPLGKSWVGAYDMFGNVFQWVADWFSDTYYSTSPTNDPTGPKNGQYRVQRGGSFYTPQILSSAFRDYAYYLDLRSGIAGIRVVVGALPG